MKKIISVILAVILAAVCFCTPVYADAATEELGPYIKSKLENFESDIDISSITKMYGWDKDTTIDMVAAAFFTYPELFYVSTEYNYSYVGKTVYNVSFSFTMDRSKAAAAKKKLDAAAQKIVAGITDDMTDVEKALYVHDAIILSCRYDESYSKRTSYDCLVSGSALCQGYSLAYSYILNNYLGIDCTVVFSNSQNHMWNYVKIGNKWYHVDLTNDDPTAVYKTYNYDQWGVVMHSNFLMSDSRCRKVSGLHRDWFVAGGYPAASDTSYDNAFWQNVRSRICYSNGACYYAYDAGKDSSNRRVMKVCMYDKKTRSSKVVLKMYSKWFARRNSDSSSVAQYGTRAYIAAFMSLDIYNGKLYLNTNKAVYSYDLSTKATKKIYTLNKGEEMQIFGLVHVGDYIRLAYKQDVTYPEKYISLRIKQN